MRVTPEGFARMTDATLQAVPCPVAVALEGGYNSQMTCACCEAVLRVMLGEPATESPPTLLASSVEPTLRAVIGIQRAHWPALRYRAKSLDAFFAEAARVGSAHRVSKRARTAPVFADEEQPISSVALPAPARPSKRPKKGQRAVTQAAQAAARKAALDEAAAGVRAAEAQVAAARRRVREAEGALRHAEEALATARASASELAENGAEPGEEDEGGDESEEGASDEQEDARNGSSNPRGVVAWSTRVRCEPGRRCVAQYGVDRDELWFCGTVVAVHRTEIGQWVDVQYDDGDFESMKPIKRVKAFEEESSDEGESEDDG